MTFAQKDMYEMKEIFLFDSFQDGVINFIISPSTKAKINYGTVSEKIYFLDKDSTILELTNFRGVSTVQIADRTFEHIKEGILYEKIVAGDFSFYIRWRTKYRLGAKTGAYGMQTETSSITNYSSIYGQHSGETYHLKTNQQVKTSKNNEYYVKLNGKFKKFNSLNALAKLFKAHQDTIRKYIETEKLKFENIEDIQKAVAYAASLYN